MLTNSADEGELLPVVSSISVGKNKDDEYFDLLPNI
jgi:hypothetical protein